MSSIPYTTLTPVVCSQKKHSAVSFPITQYTVDLFCGHSALPGLKAFQLTWYADAEQHNTIQYNIMVVFNTLLKFLVFALSNQIILFKIKCAHDTDFTANMSLV